MGSLNAGQPISHNSYIHRNNGEAVTTSNITSDEKITDKFHTSYETKLKQLEDSIMGMPDRLVWLDASDTSTVTTEDGLVTEWADKTANGIVADNSLSGASLAPATASLDIGGGLTRSVLHFDEDGKQLTLGTQLDSMVGAGRSFTIYMACRPTDIRLNDDFVSILSKFDDTNAAFYVYIYDNIGYDDPVWGITGARFKTEVYTDTFDDGATTMGHDSIIENKTFVFRSEYDCTQTGTDRISLRTNATDDVVESDLWIFSFGAGISDINDNDEPLTIGKHGSADAYRGFVGYFMELLIFNKVHSEEERNNVETYLGLKWGASQHFTDLRLGTD